MTDLPDIRCACPVCRTIDAHFIDHRPAPAGVFASWPDPAADHYLRECRACGHQWRQPS